MFVVAAATLAVMASVFEPAGYTPKILSEQGQLFYPKFTDPQAVRTIEVVDYDEATATARPFQVTFEKNRWVIASNNNYPVDIGDRLVKTAGALIDLKKDTVVSDAPQQHAKYGVIDPLDQKAAELAGRGKRVTLRDAHKEVLADFILGKPVEGKRGMRYVRLPSEKRVYAVKTDADPSARFADWVNARLLSISRDSIRKATVNSYQIDEQMGRLVNQENIVVTREGGQWKIASGPSRPAAKIDAMAAALDGLKIVDARPKPPTLAQDLRSGELRLSLEISLSMRQKGFLITQTGRLLSNEGELIVETANGLQYVLRFGEVATTPGEAKSENRYLFVTVTHDPQRAARYGDTSGSGERMERELTNRFADWFYIISSADFAKLRLK
jgi:hypothetical protein